MVIITQLFGRIYEIWSHEGLGPVEYQFVTVYDEDKDGEVAWMKGVLLCKLVRSMECLVNHVTLMLYAFICGLG